MYPNVATWPTNVKHFDHVSPERHAEFYSSSPLTLNITRGSMAAMGYCPSGRLFEAAACSTAVLSDWWTGLDTFFEPGQEILIASSSAEAMAAIQQGTEELKRVGKRARQRALDCHTATIRAQRLIELIEDPQDETEEAGANSIALKGT
jgi:spore maturation protein CgeB